MMWLITALQKRPKDSTIRIINIILWVIYIALISSSFYYTTWELNSSLFFNLLDISNYSNIIEYITLIPWILFILIWAFNLTIFKKNIFKYFQIFSWFLMIYIANIIKLPTSSFLTQTDLIWLMWFIIILWGISWKFITQKQIKFKQKITKIRV